MAALEHVSSTSRFAARPSLLVHALRAVSNIYRAFRNRREFYRLGEFSDAQLADIGLTRADLYVAVGNAFAVDPTVTLGAIVRRRAEDDIAGARKVC
ncbi:DUF1127 domain-containing protein [Mesorhizobium sp. BAC0120]|uniref:DUF1127 domain-containing protein n=1 Tax=Mesorhizobium sp. BAC0120 TaxID=3090670 RepID=UPI00298D44D6|nr:DUF1127 domain-containing protein [Mesorhizobium sp. BAC0120]MDW6025147.1 DUF1127 domain-containing protein [Mesorhizobium sp. BAC0120]